MSEKVAGWYPDPSGDNQQRFWDGDGWTEYYQPLVPQSTPSHDASTAMADYPYLAGQSGAMTTPTIPPPEGWSEPTNTWSTPQQTTTWGTPASPQDYAGGEYRPPASPGDAGAGTQVYRSGTQGGRGGRGGLIAAVVASCVVVALLIVGGVMAFRNGGGSETGPTPRDTADGVVEVEQTTAGSVPSDGEWVGALTITDGGAYLVDARADDAVLGGDDLQLALRDADGASLAYNDDRGSLLRMGADRLDPLVVYDLEAGEYEVALTEYQDQGADFTVEVYPLTEQIGLQDSVEVQIEENGAYLAVLEVTDDVTIDVDVRAQGGGDPTLTIRSLERDAMWSDDDRGGGAHSLDPLLEDLELRPGNYAVMVAEYFSAPVTVQIDISSS